MKAIPLFFIRYKLQRKVKIILTSSGSYDKKNAISSWFSRKDNKIYPRLKILLGLKFLKEAFECDYLENQQGKTTGQSFFTPCVSTTNVSQSIANKTPSIIKKVILGIPFSKNCRNVGDLAKNNPELNIILERRYKEEFE